MMSDWLLLRLQILNPLLNVNILLTDVPPAKHWLFFLESYWTRPHTFALCKGLLRFWNAKLAQFGELGNAGQGALLLASVMGHPLAPLSYRSVNPRYLLLQLFVTQKNFSGWDAERIFVNGFQLVFKAEIPVDYWWSIKESLRWFNGFIMFLFSLIFDCFLGQWVS